ncbi:MAG: HD-GYP domain-containing protein [Actinomycetota bacterium]|nr:HD-GYP domain-containing protein [Actinomycetota bacterium]
MGKQCDRKLVADLPFVFVATFLVAVAPLLLVLWLRGSGAVTSAWVGTAIGVGVSLLASYAGAKYWKTRTESRDVLFCELMLWGWVQRWRSERRLVAAADVLGLTAGRPQAVSGGRLTDEQKAGLLTQLTSGLEARDPYTHGHSRRVARLAANIAKRMGLSREEVAKIRAAGAMHDVGKAKTPVAVLRKESRLTDEEYAIMKRHAADGAVMVSTLRDDELTAMVRHHHERLDGTGYPDRLAGEAIPIGARILAVADTFDAITSTRPYRPAHAHKEALAILAAGAGTQLDPDAVRAFVSSYAGRRPLAYWMLLAYGRPRLASLLGGGLGPVNGSAVTSAMATLATTAAVGGTALGTLLSAPVDSSRAVADAGTPTASSLKRSGLQAPGPQASVRAVSAPSPSSPPRTRPGPNRGATKMSAQDDAGARDTAGRQRKAAGRDDDAGETKGTNDNKGGGRTKTEKRARAARRARAEKQAKAEKRTRAARRARTEKQAQAARRAKAANKADVPGKAARTGRTSSPPPTNSSPGQTVPGVSSRETRKPLRPLPSTDALPLPRP